MPNPTQSDLHINQPLTNVSIAWMQSASTYIADKVFPKVPVQKQSDLYWKYSKSDWRRSDVKRRAPATESPGTGWNVDEDTYFAHVYAVHKDIDDQLRANADSVFNLDRDATEFITNQLLLQRDIDWNNSYFKAGVWTTDLTGVASGPTGTQFVQWDATGSDPIKDVANLVLNFRKLTGFKPNICVLGASVMVALKQHPDIIDRIKYTQRGIVTEDLIATLFDVDELYTSYATSASGPQIPDARTQDAAATYDFIGNSKGVLFAYAPSGPSLMTPSAGYTFTWRGYLGGNAQGIKIKRFRMEHIASDRIEAEQTYDMKVVAPDLGVFMASAVA
jgi:hypothetical protein